MAATGRFITVEGGEGVGKSLFTAGLARALRSRSRELVTSREPGGTPVADAVRGLFAAPPAGEPLTMETEALLVSAARAQHVSRLIRPALARGAWVLCDRFADSTRVYQGILGGLDAREVEALIRFSTGGLAPDLTFLLDCDVAVAQARLARRAGGGRDPVERYDHAQLSFHQRLRDAYRDLASFDGRRFHLISADQPAEVMVAEALRQVEARFGSR